jgi:60 kDa SS-A/Ro ribonucleoprotein
VAFKYTRHFAKRGETPQTSAIPGRESEMSQNAAGGYVFEISDWTRLRRFLILGSEGGTFYVNSRDLTIENADVVVRCVSEDGIRTVREIVTISESGIAPKNDAAILALALASKRGDDETRKFALSQLSKVCRTGTHLFEFAAFVEIAGGWGRGTRTAVGKWYVDKAPDDLAYQLVKYRQREGWSHADLLRLSHPKPSATTTDLLAFAANKPTDAVLPAIVEGYQRAREARSPEVSAQLISEYGLPRECIRTEHLSEPEVLSALLETMPLTAMIRSLGTLSAAGVVSPFSEGTAKVTGELRNAERLQKSRVHPMALFLALTTYASGHGVKGRLTWTPVQQVVDALNDAFYGALTNVLPSGKRLLLAVDVSGSMRQVVTGSSVSAAEAAAAMALIVARTEPNHLFLGVNTAPVELRISPRMRLDEATKVVVDSINGGTDLAVPARWLRSERLDVDAIVTLTDSETWSGRQHPAQALASYRDQVHHDVRNVVAALTSTGHSIGDTGDALTLQCVGLDSSLPEIIRGFVNAEI